MKAPKQYKGVNVVRSAFNRKGINASYNRFSKRITLYDAWFTYDDAKQERILEHEYAHHIYYKMPSSYRKLWKAVSNGKLMKVLEIMGAGKYKKNGFITKYAEKNEREDFAEIIEEMHKRRTRYSGYLAFKIQTAEGMMKYFDK